MPNITDRQFEVLNPGAPLKLIAQSARTFAAAEEKIAIIEKRAQELDNTSYDKDAATGVVDAYVPSKSGYEQTTMKKDGAATVLSQTVSTTKRRAWYSFTKDTITVTERYTIKGNQVNVAVEQTHDDELRLLWGAIRSAHSATASTSFDYVRP